MSMEESISLEETNKIRISLGLKPLTDDSEPALDKDKEAESNYAKRRELEAKERETKKIKERIDKVRNKRELQASLKGSTLGDADGDEDTLKWIKKSKKREKELAKKRQEELENMDKVFQGDEYTERDLEGLKVGHDFEGMEEGEDRILTLKDSRILDNEEDELQNIEMAEAEQTKKKNEMKIKRRDYTGYDDDEFTPGSQGMKRAVLAKYDEELNGPIDSGFRLGASTLAKSQKTRQEEQKQEVAASVNKTLLSIDYAKNLETADYLKEGDVGFKKPKTKKKRPSRRAGADSDIVVPDDQMDIDQKPIVPRARDLNANFVDDDELQAALARSRQAKLTKTKKLTPEQLAKKIAEQRAQEEQGSSADVKMEADLEDIKEEEGSGLTFDDTSEFIRSVGNNPIPVKVEPRDVSTAPSAQVKQRSPSRDVSMAPADEAMDEMEAGEYRVKEEDEEDEMAMLNALENAITAQEAEDQAKMKNGGVADDAVGTSSEQNFSTGMASTLNILRQQGLLAPASADLKQREQTQLQRDRWLAQQRLRVAQRELEKLQARGGNKDQSQREYENRLREQQEARETLEGFKEYKPDVNIEYHDEFGRTLTPKEAWKALSHKFHGKGSGRMKTEKRLKKIEEERKKAAMASGDTPLSMNSAFQQRQEKTGQAHFVLSVGNRGTVPQVADFLETQPLTKGGKTEKARRKKEAKNGLQANGGGFMTVPAPPVLGADSPMPSGFSSIAPSKSASPAPKPGFSRIQSAVDTPVGSNGGTPRPGERSKVAIEFGTKRKAGEDPPGTPPAKRR